jgi:hypothetical protein
VVLVVLAVVWAVVLIPPWLRNRAEGRPGDSIGAFHRQLTTLERTGPETAPPRTPAMSQPRPAARPASARSRLQRRRRGVILVLGAAMVSTLMLSFIPGLRVMLVLHATVDVLFFVYVALLVRVRTVSAEREMKLRFLPGTREPVEPVLALRRSAN